MGISLVVIVENSKGISLLEFRDALLKTKHGWFVWREPIKGDSDTPWEEFEFQKKRYFSWVFSLRSHYFNLWPWLGNDDTEKHKTYRARLFKALLEVEKIAGGSVYVGHDFVDTKLPYEPEQFSLPVELDDLWIGWREIAEKSELPKDYP